MRIWRFVVEHRCLNEPNATNESNRARPSNSSDMDTDPASTMVIVECQMCGQNAQTPDSKLDAEIVLCDSAKNEIKEKSRSSTIDL